MKLSSPNRNVEFDGNILCSKATCRHLQAFALADAETPSARQWGNALLDNTLPKYLVKVSSKHQDVAKSTGDLAATSSVNYRIC